MLATPVAVSARVDLKRDYEMVAVAECKEVDEHGTKAERCGRARRQG